MKFCLKNNRPDKTPLLYSCFNYISTSSFAAHNHHKIYSTQHYNLPSSFPFCMQENWGPKILRDLLRVVNRVGITSVIQFSSVELLTLQPTYYGKAIQDNTSKHTLITLLSVSTCLFWFGLFIYFVFACLLVFYIPEGMGQGRGQNW